MDCFKIKVDLINMNRKYLILSVGLLFFWLCSSTFLRNNIGSSVRYFNDDVDRLDYFIRGMWLPEGKVPYRDVFSEYPQISTYLFGLVFLPFLKETDIRSSFISYSTFFSLLMVYTLIALAISIEKELPDEKKQLLFFLLLPAPLYYTFNRFDVLPAFISLIALLMAKRKNWEFVACLLGVGALTKWYPALLVPPVAVYMFYKRESYRRILEFIFLFGLICLIILLPTFIAGGFRAVLVPYVNLQNNRGYDSASFLALMLPIIRSLIPGARENILKTIFLLMQFSAIPLLFFACIDSFERLLNCCLLAISTFMLFAPLYSPQWLLWIFPLMILLARDKWDVGLIVLYGVLTYIEFPVAYDYFGAASFQMLIMGWVNVLLLILIIVQAVKRFHALSISLPVVSG